MIVVEKVLVFIMAIIDFRKSIIRTTLKIATFDSLLNIMPSQILIVFRFQQLQKFPNFKRSYLETSIIAHEYFFHYSLHILFPRGSHLSGLGGGRVMFEL